MIRLLLLFCLICFALPATADGPGSGSSPPARKWPVSFECRWTDSPPVIDGDGTDAAWKNATVIDSFHLPWLGEKARAARSSTVARLLWDREHLYFLAEMDDPSIVSTITEHDGALWTNDAFEMFLRPDTTKSGYYEFQVAPNGTRFDAFYPRYGLDVLAKGAKDGSFLWEAKAKPRGAGKAPGWTVEARLPWTDFLRTGGRPVAGETWKLNLCRVDYSKEGAEPELSCVAPIAVKKIGPYFHQTDDYADLVFKGSGRGAAKPHGMESRVALTTSKVNGFPDPPPPYAARRATGFPMSAFPICARTIPGSGEMLLVGQSRAYGPSAVYRVAVPAEGPTAAPVKLLDTPGEGTAYDIAFHPRWKENGFVYFGWNGKLPGKADKHSAISRYTMSTKPPFTIDPATETTIIAWPSDGHNGAAVCFGKDGLMFVTSGDGTSDSDGNLMGQRTDTLLAKVLRIDVDHPGAGKAYSVPKDNPFAADKNFVPETWAYGLRAPWRISYDPADDQLWVCQNGQDLWEQAFLVKGGENFGWSVMEGSHPFYPDRKAGPTPFTKPTVEHHHSEARSLTGGFVYRGKALPELVGAYVYGDHSTGHIWAVRHTGGKIAWHKKIAITTLRITGFAVDPAGELLVLHHAPEGEGGFFRLEANTAKADASFPRRLSESGLFESVKDHRMAQGVIPYSVNAPFWSDGLHKARFMAVPEGTVGWNPTKSWDFPEKTVLVKSFALETRAGDPASRKWIETRFMTRQGGEWYGYSYRWNDEGTDATLLPAAGADAEYRVEGGRSVSWHYPSRAECMVCHSRAANFVLGLCDGQLNRDQEYPGGGKDNQLRALEHIGMLSVNWAGHVTAPKEAAQRQQPNQRTAKPATMLPRAPEGLARFADPYDKSQPLEARARSWLHTNCATCHVEAGGGNAQMKLDIATPLEKAGILDAKPLHQAFGIPDARLLAPGDPARSVLIRRMAARGPGSGQMPPLSSAVPDRAAVELFEEWCRALKPKP